MSLFRRLVKEKIEKPKTMDGMAVSFSEKPDANGDVVSGKITFGYGWPTLTFRAPPTKSDLRLWSEVELRRYYRDLPTAEIWDAMSPEEQEAVDEAQPYNPMIAALKAR